MCILWGFILALGEVDLQIYAPLLPGQVTVSESGRLFLLDSRAGEVVIVDDQKVVKRFGRKGEGPGDFIHPSSLWWMEGSLYVMDMHAIHKFDAVGGHGGSVRKREPFELLIGVRQGWIGTQVPQFTKGVLTYFHYSRDLNKRESFFEMHFQMRPKGTYALVEDTPRLISEHTGAYAIVVDRQEGFLHVFETGTLRKKVTIKNRSQLVPMDRQWAKNKQHLIEAGMAEIRNVKPFVPDFFPPIRDVVISPENHLLVFTWQAHAREPGLEVYDFDGNSAKSEVKTLEGAKRVCAVFADQAIVSSFEDEAARVHLLDFGAVDKFVKEHPLVFDVSLLLPSLKQP